MVGIRLIIIMAIVGGLIAYLADKMGSKIGKKRMSVFVEICRSGPSGLSARIAAVTGKKLGYDGPTRSRLSLLNVFC